MDPIISWAAPIATTIAALMTASNLGSRVTGWGFGVFLVGSLLWIAHGTLTDQPNVVYQNVVLTLLNIFGMWRWLGRQAKLEEGGQKAHDASARSEGETLFPVSLLTRADVQGPDGKSLGKAVDAMAGCGSGRLVYVVVGEGGMAGVGETYRRLDWKAARIDDETLRVDRRSLEDLPELEKDKWPER